MSWYYFQRTGQVLEFTGLTKWSLDREIDAEKGGANLGLPRIWYGPYATKAEAESAHAAHPSVVTQATAAATDVTSAITNATNTLVKLWVRVAEAAVGIVLLAIAANAILKQTTGVDVAGSAVKAGKQVATAAAVA